MGEPVPVGPSDLALLPTPRILLPIDLVLALPTSSRIREMIQEQRNAGRAPARMAAVFERGRRYFAIIDFDGPGNRGLLYPLDVWTWKGGR
jgi:hypothetical protein